MTPDKVETRLGALEFFDAYPSAETVEIAYDHLDFMRGVRTFLDAMPIASLHAMREGLREDAPHEDKEKHMNKELVIQLVLTILCASAQLDPVNVTAATAITA